MNDFLTEKNKKTGVLGKLKWVLCGFCILFTLGAIGAAEKYIGEGRWGMAATEIILGLLFLYPTFREIQKALKKKKARENLAGDHIGVRPCVQLRVYSPVGGIPSNKLLTTAFEVSFESVAVTLRAKRRQQDNRDSY